MRDIITRHRDCSECNALLRQLYLVTGNSGIMTAKLSEGRWPFGHWVKISRKGER